MTNRSLEIFVAVAECGKMSEAAKQLYITQSSVSQTIAELEREYNVVLFERMSRSLFLTEAGRDLLRYARRILALNAEMNSYMTEFQHVPRIRIGATLTVGTSVISPILTELKKAQPGIRAELLVANTHLVEEQLLKNGLDIGLVEGKIRHPDLLTEQAIRDHMVVITSKDHPFSLRESVTAKDLVGEPLILREEGSGTRKQFEDEMRRRNLPIDIVWNCYNTEAIINGVAAGHGISIIAARLVTHCQDRVTAVPLEDIDMSRYFELVISKDKYRTDAIQSFMEICHAHNSSQY